MNPKKKPNYDADTILQELMDAAVEMYSRTKSLRETAVDLNLNPIKTRKLLITAGVYESATTDKIKQLKEDGKTTAEMMAATGLSGVSVNSYLPYTKIPYKADEISVNAERVRRYRERKAACEKLAEDATAENLWNCIEAFQSYPFYTKDNGLKFKYEARRDGIKINAVRISKDDVEVAFRRVLENGTNAFEKLDMPECTYLYPIFVRFG